MNTYFCTMDDFIRMMEAIQLIQERLSKIAHKESNSVLMKRFAEAFNSGERDIHRISALTLGLEAPPASPLVN